MLNGYKSRQKRHKLLLCRRILLGGSIIPSLIFRPHPHPSPRLHHCMVLHRPNARTSTHLHSFLPSTVNLWNELPSELISLLTQVTFKSWLPISVFVTACYLFHLFCLYGPLVVSFYFLEDCLTSACALISISICLGIKHV